MTTFPQLEQFWAEWEYACRAGTTAPFHFGETITTDLANYDGTDDKDGEWSGSYGRGPKGIYREETTVVGSFGVANAFGLCDMHGNVWEWCLDDWHDNYEGAPTDGSPWFDNDNNDYFQKEGEAVLRGGSWSLRSWLLPFRVSPLQPRPQPLYWFSCCLRVREDFSVALYTLVF